MTLPFRIETLTEVLLYTGVGRGAVICGRPLTARVTIKS